MQPQRVVARTGGDDRVVRDQRAELAQGAGEIHLELARRRRCERVRCPVQRARPVGVAGGIRPVQLQRGGDELRRARVDRERRLEHPAELLGIGVDVDQRLARTGRGDQLVGAGRRLVEPRAEREQQVGIRARGARAPGRSRGRACRRTTASGCRRSPGSGTRPRRASPHASHSAAVSVAARSRPSAAADEHERALGAGDHVAARGRPPPAGASAHDLVRRAVAHVGAGGEHVLGQPQHDRPRPPGERDAVGAAHVLGDPRRVVDRRRPLRHRRRTHPGCRSPARPRDRDARAGSARRTGSAGPNPAGRCARRPPPGWPPAPRGEHDPGTPVSWPWARPCSPSRPPFARRRADLADVVQRVEHRQIALARDAERPARCRAARADRRGSGRRSADRSRTGPHAGRGSSTNTW